MYETPISLSMSPNAMKNDITMNNDVSILTGSYLNISSHQIGQNINNNMCLEDFGQNNSKNILSYGMSKKNEGKNSNYNETDEEDQLNTEGTANAYT